MRWLMGLVPVLLSGCVPSKESMTAGQVGCQPSEITIQEGDSSSGLVESTETWTAECKGRRFICSKTTGGGWASIAANPKPAGPPSSQISCREEVEAAGATQGTAPAASAAAESAPPPKGAAGFDFGLTADEAKAVCEGAGKVWNAESAGVATCSGSASKVGFDAFVSVKFCDTAACFISVRVASAPDWSVMVGDLKTKLSKKYGEPRASTPIPTDCSSSQDFTRCFKDGDQKLRYTWSWPSGEQMLLLVGKPAAGGESSIRLQYKRAGQSGVDASAL